MQQQQQPALGPWRLPMAPISPRSHSPKIPYLQHTNSMLNLHEEPTWHWPPRSPPSPTASSTSSASRSATPTNPASSNPWASIIDSAESSPRDSPQSRTPRYTSRSATPVAPQPMRPVMMSVGLTPTSPTSPPGDRVINGADSGLSPIASPMPNPYRANAAASTLPPLGANVFITPALLTQYGLAYADVIRRQGWGSTSAKLAYQWATSNPKTALLLLMCDDVVALRKATIFGGVEDDKLPHSVTALQGIAVNPRKVVGMQWRVMVKELPPNGQHMEFRGREEVPLEAVSVISTPGTGKSVDKVRWLGYNDDRVYARKRLVFGTPSQKTAILAQIQKLKSLEHPNIARLLCSYSHGTVIGLVTSYGHYSLEDYLQLPLDSNRSKFLLDWISDLTQALAHIHSMDTAHKGIRPHKILIDSSRVFFAAFGISSAADTSPTRHMDHTSTSEQSYIYAAPETISRRKLGRPADVFALGCIFLMMMTVVKGQSVSSFHSYRASGSRDPSFHANLDRVSTWRKQLQTISNPAMPQRREREALEFIGAMLVSDPLRRVKMKKLAPHVAEWSETRAIERRRSFDGMNGVRRMEVGSLDIYYGAR